MVMEGCVWWKAGVGGLAEPNRRYRKAIRTAVSLRLLRNCLHCNFRARTPATPKAA